MRNYNLYSGGIFSVSSLVRILMTSFPAFRGLLGEQPVCVDNKKENFKTINFLPLDIKVDIFAPPCRAISVYICGHHDVGWMNELISNKMKTYDYHYQNDYDCQFGFAWLLRIRCISERINCSHFLIPLPPTKISVVLVKMSSELLCPLPLTNKTNDVCCFT